MMRLSHQLSIIVLLSLAAAGGGILLARARSLPESAVASPRESPRISNDRMAVASSTTSAEKKEPGIRSIIASAPTKVLWEWLAVHATEEKAGGTRYEILSELYAREGLTAWATLLEGGDTEVREKLSDGFLGMLSNSDPWLSHELFLKNKDAFGKRWGVSANTNTLKAACAISADKYIEVMEQSGFPDTNVWFHTELPAGFDFARLVAHLEISKLMPSGLPDNLIGQWATQSLEEAAEWLAAQPKVDENGPMRYLLEDDRALSAVFRCLAETSAPGREEGLAAFTNIPVARIDKAWDRLAENQEGKIS